MSRLTPKKPTFPPCALCGAPSDLDVWQYALCVKCHGLWHKDVQPPPDNAQWNPEANVRQAAWRKVTMDWLEKARKARAA